MPTTTSLNTRVFAPYVLLTQDTSRIAIKIKSGEGYTLPNAPGITLGDVIRYDPLNGYTLSRANTEENAEVVGVVESYSGSDYTVVISGSIKYPATRLAGITGGGAGGVDILFLDEAVAGGLTGSIDLTGTGEKIVKPVVQVSPHSVYNAVVLNYIGYKTGNQAVSEERSGILAPGAVMYGPSTSSPGANWLDATDDLLLSVADYPDLYSKYSYTSGPFVEKININPTSGTLSTSYIGEIFQEYLTGASVLTRTGTITDVDTTNNLIYVTKNAGSALIDTSATFYLNTVPFKATSSSVYQYTVPKIESSSVPTQAGSSFVPYIKAYEITSVKVPGNLTIETLTVEGTMTLDTITNLKTKIDNMQAQIDTLNSRVIGP